MAQLNVAPTKTNLLRLKEELKFAELGYELLDQKRNILVVELLSLIDQTVDHQNRIDAALAEAYKILEQAVLRMGKLKIQHCLKAIHIETKVQIRARRVMGVTLPIVETEINEKAPFYSLLGTSSWMDSSVEAFKSVLKLMGKLVELKISVVRLANEVRKTIRKVNALEKNAIPDLKDTVSYIENRLEENERDMFVIMKMVKDRLEAKSEGFSQEREKRSGQSL